MLMKDKVIHIVIFLLLFQVTKAQIVIESGTTLNIKSGTYTVLTGNYSNAGTMTPAAGSVFLFKGSSSQSIVNANGETFEDFTINKSTNDVTLSNNVTINGTLTLTSGGLNLNSNSLSMGDNSNLVESSGNTISGGSASTNRSLNAPSGVNVGGLGASVSSVSNLGSTTVTRGHTAYVLGSSNSIKRYYNISPTTNTGLDATLVFSYDDSELNGITEANLVLFRSTDGGTTWTKEGGLVDTDNNTITLSSIDGFSTWTAGDANEPLPVELTSFIVITKKKSVTLNWGTATEIDNYGFEIERASTLSKPTEDVEWENIGFVEGAGNSNSPKAYNFNDLNPNGGINRYRLKQIDTDGSFEYSEEIESEILLPKKHELYQNYPNPFNPSTTIQYDLPEDGMVKIIIYNSIGEQVKVLVNETKEAGYHKVEFNGTAFASGFYIFRMQTTNFTKTKKMIILK